jgi:myo-inositol-1-phosphate synthase
MSKVRVAIAGLGNCANSLIQGVEYYKNADADLKVPGLMHIDLGGYHVGDVEFVAAFDVDSTKVGQDISKGMWGGQNNTIEFCEVGNMDVEVLRGPTFDGIGKYYCGMIEESATHRLHSTQASVSSTPSPYSSHLTRSGHRSSSTLACRSSVTTSSPRLVRPSSTASSHASSRTVVSTSTTPTS